MTIRIGIVGTDNGHAHLFSGWINGWSDDVPVPARPAGYLDSFYLRWAARRTELILESAWGPQRTPISDARVTKIWGAVPGEAELIARACDVEHVSASLEDAVTDVDAVMVLSDLGSDHLEHARPSLEAGLPTYIDKPLAPSVEGAREIADLAAAHGAPWFTASSLAFSYQVTAARSMIDGLGGLRSMQTKVQNRWADYGIHSFEMAAAFMGRDVKTMRGHTVGTSDVMTIEYRDGRIAVLQNVGGQSRPSYCATLFCGLGTHFVDITDSVVTSLELIEAFLDMVRHGSPPPVSAAEAIRSIEVVSAGMDALRTGKVVDLGPFEG
ncbi:MAG: Gfo/Idh/MocA family protein [Ilumatobacteraceae bacterium]